ncbi:MAG: hypothetical protein M1814_006487 [Vezdaea aestivalis]|nr:MAG: hypothetical protein M1814_006487 [Vezdaea aestivalis]
MATLPTPDAYLVQWFKGADPMEIKRENLNDFWRWSFLNTKVTDEEFEDEVNEYTDAIEKALGRRLESGRGSADPIRLTLDKVDYRHRPLFWYLIVSLVDNYTHLYMIFLKFRYFRTPLALYPSIIPPRPQTLLTTHVSPSKRLSYWYRPHKSPKKLPIVFVHGIGIGLVPYVPFLGQLNSRTNTFDGEVGILAIEILPLSFRISGSMLAKEDMCRQIQTILSYHEIKNFVLVTHSCGSMIATHLLDFPPLAPQISSLVFIDPVTLLLHLPHIAYNFSYRLPIKANEWQLWYFASKDISVAHTLHRTFFWSETCIFKEELAHLKTSVFLSGRDLIVDTQSIRDYLIIGDAADGEVPDASHEEWTGANRLKVFYAPELDHAQIFDVKRRREKLVATVLEHCRTR